MPRDRPPRGAGRLVWARGQGAADARRHGQPLAREAHASGGGALGGPPVGAGAGQTRPLLPRWRGAAPVERAIMAGDPKTGVTVHRTVRELDAGPWAAMEEFPIEPDDDAGAVFARAAELAPDLVDHALSRQEFSPQAEVGVTYAEKIGPADRELDWSRPAQELH